LPGRVLPEHPIDLRIWVSGAGGLAEMLWLGVSLNVRLKDLLGPVTRVKKKTKKLGVYSCGRLAGGLLMLPRTLGRSRHT